MSVDFSAAWKTGGKIVENSIALLPNLVLAVIIFVLFIFLASASKSFTRRFTTRRHKRQGVALLLGQLAQTTILIVGFIIALAVVAPSFQAKDLVGMLGIGSVAIGFAFQNILQNFLAGILLMIQEPFELGDLISVTGLEGIVDDIQTRATIITTKEGRRVFIPNATLFTNPVAVSSKDAAGKPTSNSDEYPPRNEEKPSVVKRALV